MIFFNTPDWREHPIKKKIDTANSMDYMVQATHFPKWFVGKNSKLQTLDKWREDWSSLVNQNQNVNTLHFAPPRDANSRRQENVRRKTDSDGNYETMDIYNELSQTNLALICEHGHLMDIPWSKYINIINPGNDTINLNVIEPCCGNPSLKWTESTNKSEGFENVFVECTSCGKKKNLGGINSFKCICNGYKPWEIEVTGSFSKKSFIPSDKTCSHEGKDGEMQVSLVTANRMYYATGKNSLFIPLQLKPEGFENQDLLRALRFCETRFEKRTNVNITKEEFFEKKVDDDFLVNDAGINVDIVNKEFLSQLKLSFLNHEDNQENVLNEYDEENYRLYEYKCFSKNQKVDEIGLRFDNVELPDNLNQYFTSIKQVSELKVTQVQLSFNRNEPRIAFQDNNSILKYSSNAKRIFEGKDEDQFVLPAVQNYGEGIFFQFNENSINTISSDERIQNLLSKNLQPQDQGFGTWDLFRKSGQKYFIIHTFSHLIMRELEFACGYPTASLKERLYISSEGNEFMAGVLIYTTDGSEGSMGGLVSQASEHNIEKLIQNALLRGVDCSSDPLCWESEGQGLFDFNLAACFSCSLVSETACEAMNLGLDRRVLVSEEFGYFKSLINFNI